MDSSIERKFYSLVAKFEGGKLHRNSNESDITTGYGIYRGAHPNASIFSYIDKLAMSINIFTPSNEWTKDEINSVNHVLSYNEEAKEKEYQLTVDFYRDYFKKVDYEGVPDLLNAAYKLIYINGTKIANKALQSTYNAIAKIVGETNVLKVDGLIGSGSKSAFKEFNSFIEYNSEVVTDYTLLAYFISYAKSFYIDISTDELPTTGTDKHLRYLQGWDNRCNTILETLRF